MFGPLAAKHWSNRADITSYTSVAESDQHHYHRREFKPTRSKLHKTVSSSTAPPSVTSSAAPVADAMAELDTYRRLPSARTVKKKRHGALPEITCSVSMATSATTTSYGSPSMQSSCSSASPQDHHMPSIVDSSSHHLKQVLDDFEQLQQHTDQVV